MAEWRKELEERLRALLATAQEALRSYRHSRKVSRGCAWIVLVCILTWYPAGGVLLVRGEHHGNASLTALPAKLVWLLVPVAVLLVLQIPIRLSGRKQKTWLGLSARSQASAMATALGEALVKHTRTRGMRAWALAAAERELLSSLDLVVGRMALTKIERDPFSTIEEDKTELALPAVLGRVAWPAVAALEFPHQPGQQEVAAAAAKLLQDVSTYLLAREMSDEDDRFGPIALSQGEKIRQSLPLAPVEPRLQALGLVQRFRTAVDRSGRAVFDYRGPLWRVIVRWFVVGYMVGLAASGMDWRTAAVVGATFVLTAGTLRLGSPPQGGGGTPGEGDPAPGR